MTVGAVCDWYLAEAASGRLFGRKRQPIKASTLYMDRSRIETHSRPLIGRRPVAALILADVERTQTDIAAGKTAKPRGEEWGRATVGGRGAAARSVTTLHSVFGHAKRHELIDGNPAAGVRKFLTSAAHGGSAATSLGGLAKLCGKPQQLSTPLASQS